MIIGPINYLVLKRLDRRELAWITMPLSTPLLPSTIAASSQPGDSLLLHVLASGISGQSLRIGGVPVGNASYASLATMLRGKPPS